jgi:hypothetical protein
LNERNAETLNHDPGDKLFLHLSPDGHWLMYFVYPGGFSPTKAPLLMRAPLAGGPSEFIFKARPGSDFSLPEGAGDYVFLERTGKSATRVLCP